MYGQEEHVKTLVREVRMIEYQKLVLNLSAHGKCMLIGRCFSYFVVVSVE